LSKTGRIVNQIADQLWLLSLPKVLKHERIKAERAAMKPKKARVKKVTKSVAWNY
jgi:hypothetical protein